MVRYQLPVVVIVFNNGGVYGGDRRNPEEITGPFKDDPAPTSFVPGASYHVLIEAFGGKGYLVGTPDELKSALSESFTARKPAVINVTIDPYAGAESGRMQHKNWGSLHTSLCFNLYISWLNWFCRIPFNNVKSLEYRLFLLLDLLLQACMLKKHKLVIKQSVTPSFVVSWLEEGFGKD